MKIGWTISRYIAASVLPYFLFSWILLSVILFVQQGSRFSDIFFSASIPSSLIWQLSIALIPNVIAFTCPMAVLVGVVIGLTKMQGDSEMVAIRASGASNLQIMTPMIVLGVLLSVFTIFINLFGVPLAASVVRGVALRAAIYKLESPIEPGVFNTEISGYTVYVKHGDLNSGEWQNIFIHQQDPKNGSVRLITSRRGRIDSSGDTSELVLENAASTVFNIDPADPKYVSENINQLRLVIKTRKDDLVQRLGNSEMAPEELGLAELSRYAGEKEGEDRVEANILLQRRLILSISPLIFCILGTSMVLRFNRGGRGFAMVLALISLIGFYLFTFLGEQLARTGKISVIWSAIIPLSASLLAFLWLNYVSRYNIVNTLYERIRSSFKGFTLTKPRVGRGSFLLDITTGIRDFDLITNLFRYYVLTLFFLSTVFIVFTAFELWKFAGVMDRGITLLAQYILYLFPFIYLQLAPSAAMIAVLATYVIKSRQNEIVTWTAAGQSVYRLLFPAFVIMLILGGFNLLLQETILPDANKVQDATRMKLRSRGKITSSEGKLWVANDDRIYSFRLNSSASDNEKHVIMSCDTSCPLNDVEIYSFNNEGILQTLYRSPTAEWDSDEIKLPANVTVTDFSTGVARTTVASNISLAEDANPLLETLKKPSHLNIGETRHQIENSESDIERRSLRVALEKKWSTLILPFVIALFTAPFALSLSRTGKAATVGVAVGLWLVFMGVSAVFEQFGINGSLHPQMAVWAPIGIFAFIGVYLLSRVRT